MINIKTTRKQWKHLKKEKKSKDEQSGVKRKGHGNTLMDLLLGELLILIVWTICYRDFPWILPLQLLLLPAFSVFHKMRDKRKRKQYKKGFVNLLQSIMTSLQAGYTLENACKLSMEELKELYRNEKEPIILAFEPVIAGLALKMPLEELFYQFAGRTQLEEIWQFATILEIASSTGGNVVEIIRNAMQQMQSKLDAEQEVEVILSGKIYEKNIMLLMPFAILLYLSLVNRQYVSIFYDTLAGHIIMSGLLLGAIACFYWTEHIMEGIIHGR